MTKFAEIAAPCTSATNVSASAGTISAGTTASDGQTGVGSPSTATPRSSNVATPTQPNTAAAPEVTTTATTRPRAPTRVRSSRTISAIVARPTARLAQSSCPGESTVFTARKTRFEPSAAYPVRFGSWPSTMFTPTALMNPTITAFETNRKTVPSRSRPGRQHRDTRQDRQRKQRPRTVRPMHPGDVGDHHRHRPRPLHDHERRRRSRRTDHRAHEIPIQPRNGIHPRQQPRRETVRDTLHPEHQTGRRILPQRLPPQPKPTLHVMSPACASMPRTPRSPGRGTLPRQRTAPQEEVRASSSR